MINGKYIPLFISAPSRSGSSLLTTLLNCSNEAVIINEPPNSVEINNHATINSVYEKIRIELMSGCVMQRLSKSHEEITDSYPPEDSIWQKKKQSFNGSRVIGIKKSFPAFSNIDYFDLFLNEWENFVKWLIDNQQGKLLLLVRDPVYTILSWKTTFQALKSDTESQCKAWNLIALSMLKVSNSALILRYEDIVSDYEHVYEKVGDYLIGNRLSINKSSPEIRHYHNTYSYYINNRDLNRETLDRDVKTIQEICSDKAASFGYFK